MISADAWFAREMDEHRKAFERGDYTAFFNALMLCFWNERPLPEWLQAIVIAQAEKGYEASTGPGRHGNWRAKLSAIQIDRHRHDLVALHMKARRRVGCNFVSELARAYEYGKPTPGGSYNIVTRDDIFEFAAEQLKGKPPQGTPRQIEESYSAWRHNKPKRRRQRRRPLVNRDGE